MHNSFKWAILGAKFDPEVAINLALVLAFAREAWSNGMRRAAGYKCPGDNLDGTEIWKVQKKVTSLMEARARGEESGQDCANLARLGRSLEYFGAVFTKVNHIRFHDGREEDLSICSPRLLDGILVAGVETRDAEAAHFKAGS